MVIFGQIDCIRARLVVLVQNGSIRANWLYSGKVVVFEQSGCNPSKVVLMWQRDCVWAKRLYSGKSGCNQAR